MKKNYLILLSLLATLHTGLQAQTMYVRETNGTQTDYALSSIKKMTFSSGNLVVSSTAGADASYALNDLRYLNFNDLTLGLEHNKQDAQAIFIYPNPVSDVLHLSAVGQSIRSIKIISTDGRVLLQKDLNAKNQLDPIQVAILPRGLYFCKISTETTTRTIKFLKQ